MANLTSVTFSAGTLSTGVTGTVSTIDNMLGTAGAPSANALTVQFSTNSNSSAAPQWVNLSSGASVLVSSIAGGTVNIGGGSVFVGASAPSTSAVLTTQSAATVLASVSAVSSLNSTNLKAASAILYSYNFYNNAANPRFVKLVNLASAPTAGTATVSLNIGIPPGAAVSQRFVGVVSSVGLGYFITGAIASTDTTTVSSNDVIGSIEYA